MLACDMAYHIHFKQSSDNISNFVKVYYSRQVILKTLRSTQNSLIVGYSQQRSVVCSFLKLQTHQLNVQPENVVRSELQLVFNNHLMTISQPDCFNPSPKYSFLCELRAPILMANFHFFSITVSACIKLAQNLYDEIEGEIVSRCLPSWQSDLCKGICINASYDMQLHLNTTT